MPDLEQYKDIVRDAQRQYPAWREGQAHFNALLSVDPALAEEVRGSQHDPFHRDERIPAFLALLQERWQAQG